MSVNDAIRAIREHANSGRFRAGERLPSELALAEMIGASRPTVHAALEELHTGGLIVPFRKRGWTLKRNHREPGTALGNAVGIIGVRREFSMLAKEKRSISSPGFVYLGAMAAIHDASCHGLSLDHGRLEHEGVAPFIQMGLSSVIALFEAASRPEVRKVLDQFRKRGIPVVVHADGLDLPDFDRVVSNHAAGAAMLTQWLVEQGCKRIQRVWTTTPGRELPGWIARRSAGYESACGEAGITPLPACKAMMPSAFYGQDSQEEFEMKIRLASAYLEELGVADGKIDALMLPSDRETYAYWPALERMGLIPNKDVMIVGYDNGWEDCRERHWYGGKPAATVEKDNFRTGRLLFDTVTKRLADPDGDVMEVRTKPKLVIT